MQIEPRTAAQRCLSSELAVYRELGPSPHFAALVASGWTERFQYLVLEHLGPSLSQVRRALVLLRHHQIQRDLIHQI
jgi:hypothetical protein